MMSEESSRPQVPELATGEIIQRTLANVIEGITGIAGSQRSDLFLSLGHLLQRIRSGRFLDALAAEWRKYQEKGRVEDSYTYTNQHKECLQEMLDFLDTPGADEIRFTILKKILLAAAREEVTNRESLLPQQCMRLCRSLTSGEAVVLLTVYKIVARGNYPRDARGAAEWLKFVCSASGLKHVELVELHEQGLMEKRFLTPRQYPDRSGVTLGGSYRLTGLGLEVCRFIETYDKASESDEEES